MTPTQRTLKALREQGYTCAIVERFLGYAGTFGKRQDMFGIIDIVALAPDVILPQIKLRGCIIGVQSCGQSFAKHDKTILESPNSVLWIACGGKLQLWSWRKVKKKRGGKQMVWQPRIKNYSLEDFQ